MARQSITELADCSEFRQTLQARPPAVVHAMACLLMLLIAATVGWAAMTRADIVVKVQGRVRPVEHPHRVFVEPGTYLDGRVTEVAVREGDHVSKSQVLLRFDTQRLDIETAKLQRKIAAAEEELADLAQIGQLMVEQFRSAEAKARAELAQAEDEVQRAKQLRISQITEAEAEFAAAYDVYTRNKHLLKSRNIPEAEYVASKSQARGAYEKLAQARISVSEGNLEVLRRGLENIAKDYAVRRAEWKAKNAVKQGEADAARKELARLELERERSVLRAPVGGVVVSGRVNPGDVLEPGKPAYEIARQDGFRFEAAVASEDVGQLRLGMPVKIKFDAYDYQQYGTMDGKVCFVSPDSSAPGRDDAPAISYVVRVELHADEVGRRELRGKVKLGLGGVAEIVTDRQTVLAIFVKKLRGAISLG